MSARWLATLGRVSLAVWAFRVWAQFGSEPAEDGWVAAATREACYAAQRAYLDAARAYGTTVDLGDCRETTPEELERLKPRHEPVLPSAH